MPRTLFVFFLCFTAMGAAAALAQNSGEETDKSFNLLHTSIEEQDAIRQEEENIPAYEPVIPERNLEVTLTLGFWQLTEQLLAHDNIIYKYTDKNTFFGDVSLQGQSAFHPQLRLNYNLMPWFALEPVMGFSVSEYVAQVSNPISLSNQAFGEDDNIPVSIEEIGEFDAENRSCITISTGMNAVFYPRDYGNFGKGRWHPFVQGGMHHTWMILNSDYTDAASKMWDMSGGLGFRYIADDMISIRMEVMYHHMIVGFDPGTEFVVRNDGTTFVPITQWVDGQGQVNVEEFASNTLNTISWAIGFTANF